MPPHPRLHRGGDGVGLSLCRGRLASLDRRSQRTMTRRALVTGGAGFIGSHVAERLVEEGWAVVVFDDLSNGLSDNVPAAAELVVGDIRDGDSLARAASGCAAVFHLAALGSVPRSIETPGRTHDVN